MNANVQFFSNPEFGNIRTLEINNKMWFGATDVATALGYSNPQEAIRNHCKSTGVREMRTPTKGGVQNVKFVNEGNVYRLVASSQLPKAEEFESWIFDEVLTSIRKHGGYIVAQPEETPEMIMAKALQVAQITIENNKQQLQIAHGTIEVQQEQINILVPKAEYTDDVLQATSTYTFTQMAKELNFTSANTFISHLKEMNIIYKQSGQYQLTSKYAGQRYTATRTARYFHSDGKPDTSISTVWTERGRAFLHNLLKCEEVCYGN
ncbi:MAG: phage antirepressor KilAC domain-containing protein [Bacteroidales bacterium]